MTSTGAKSFRDKLTGITPTVEFDTAGHEVVIGRAAVAILERGEVLTAEAVVAEARIMRALSKGIWRDRVKTAITYLERYAGPKDRDA